MVETDNPPVWQMVREAMRELGSPTTNSAVREWILQHYPGTRTNTIACQTIKCTVNHNSRVHYAESQRPRTADGPYDFLFRPARGQLELYDPPRHGTWRIVDAGDGSLAVSNGHSNEPVSACEDGVESRRFAYESHLRDYLSANLFQIEPGLELYTDDGEEIGVEYDTRSIGRIDILAVDARGTLVVIELKVGQTPDQVCGQIMRYMSWVKRHLAGGTEVRGIIVGQEISDAVRYAVADQSISLIEYELMLKLTAVPHIDKARNGSDGVGVPAAR